MLNTTVIRLTFRGLLGGRRVLLLLAMPALLLGLALVARLVGGIDQSGTVTFLATMGLGTLIPLVGVIVGTGVIGPEIDDGSIVYLLGKPVPRSTIVHSKLVVAIGATVAFAAVPTYVAALVMAGGAAGIAAGFAVGALVASVTYSALFVLLAIVSRHAVVLGLLYALIWESLVGGFVPGAQALSVQQWGLSVAESVASPGAISANVGLGVAAALLVVVAIGATWYAGERLRLFNLTAED